MTELLIPDRLPDIPVPLDSRNLVGHTDSLNSLARLYSAGRLPHALLLSGMRGIGKATFAVHLARHILSHPDSSSAPDTIDSSDSSSSDASIIGQISQLAHPDLLYLTRSWNPTAKRFGQRLSVDEIRRCHSLFGLTSSGWRVTIVDSADDMNVNASNALLKILEEPPSNSLFILVAHRPGILLPTIRSRCRRVSLSPLSNDQILSVLSSLGVTLDRADDILRLSGGSVRRALELSSVIDDYLEFESLMSRPDDWTAAHSLAESVSRGEHHRLFCELVLDWIGMRVRSEREGNLVGYADIWERATHSMTTAEIYNLDKKQVILTLFGLLFSHRLGESVR